MNALRVMVTTALVVLAALVGAATSSAAPTVSLVSVGTELETNESAVVLPGGAVLFDTRAKLDVGDTDTQEDVYLRSTAGTITWVSTMQADIGLQIQGASDDGSKVFVETTGQLSIADLDGSGTDVYMLSGGVATLVSTGADDTHLQADSGGFEGNSADGSRVYFLSRAELVSSDTDGLHDDVFARNTIANTTEQVSTSADDTDGSADASFCGASDDGSVVAFETNAEMTTVAAEGDTGEYDTYLRTGGVTTLASTGPEEAIAAKPGNAECRAVSNDGSTVAFESFAELTTGDETNRRDVFTFSGNTTTRISTSALDPATGEHATFGDISPDGDTVYFNAADQLVSSDTNTATDGYARSPNGGVTLLTGSELPSDFAYGGTVRAVSRDGNAVVFQTNGIFAPGDADEQNSDVYVRYGGAETHQVSTSPIDGHEPSFQGRVLFENRINRDWTMSDDGLRIAFTTDAALTAADTDFPALADVYLFDNTPLPTPATPVTPVPDLTAPSITDVRLSNKSFVVDKKTKALTVAKSKPKKGTKISFTLSEAASVKLAFESRTSGRKSGSKCVKRTSKNKSAKKCTLIKTVKTAKVTGAAGANSVAFGGRIGTTTLKSGDYQVTVMATDATGNAGTSKPTKFSVVE